MQFISSDVVVIDPWHAIASEYRNFIPKPSLFSLPAPYQAPKGQQTDEEGPTSNSGLQATGGGSGGGATGDAESGDARRPPRKRCKKLRRYEPNEREQDAAARHAAYAPQLEAAAAALQGWLRASGASTVRGALLGRQAVEVAAAMDPEQAELGEAAEAQPGPDYLAMFELRHALRPRLEWPPGVAVPAPAAGSCADRVQRQDVQQQQRQLPCNLFNQLIALDGGGGASEVGFGAASTEGGGEERLALAGGHPVLLPWRCSFLMSDARQLQPLLPPSPPPPQQPTLTPMAHNTAAPTEAAGAAAMRGGGYHCILLDPPWENASAKRSGRYPTLPSRALLALPLRRLMHPVGGWAGG